MFHVMCLNAYGCHFFVGVYWWCEFWQFLLASDHLKLFWISQKASSDMCLFLFDFLCLYWGKLMNWYLIHILVYIDWYLKENIFEKLQMKGLLPVWLFTPPWGKTLMPVEGAAQKDHSGKTNSSTFFIMRLFIFYMKLF